MPFFSRRSDAEEDEVVPVEPAAPVEEPKKHGFFSRGGRDASPTPSSRTATTRSSIHTTPAHDEGAVARGGGGSSIFRRSTDASGRRSLLQRSFGNGNDMVEMDPSIVAARERVMSAENAERDADKALEEARRSVIEAREHVRRLEIEAKEEARRAKIKAYHAREVSKRGKALGRHDA
jgi:hypothetical protein